MPHIVQRERFTVWFVYFIGFLVSSYNVFNFTYLFTHFPYKDLFGVSIIISYSIKVIINRGASPILAGIIGKNF